MIMARTAGVVPDLILACVSIYCFGLIDLNDILTSEGRVVKFLRVCLFFSKLVSLYLLKTVLAISITLGLKNE